jgi:hypothetical protein
VLGDISRRSNDELQSIASSVLGGITVLRTAPRNSIIVQMTSSPGASAAAQNLLCFPFFPPHFSMPLKPGETVWIMQESGAQVGYWLCRISESDFVDDINFTHADRRHALYFDKVTTDTLVRAAGDDDDAEETNPFDGVKDAGKNPGPPGYPNGAETDEESSPTIRPSEESPTVNPFDQIYTGSLAMQSFVLEPVPRFTKRPGDLVLQGSNNTLICLGQDRGWSATNRPDSAVNSNAYVDVDSSNVATTPIPDFCGTIDIVSGRGRFYEQSQPEQDNRTVKDTQPRVIQNTRGKLEVDKNAAVYVNDSVRSSIEWNRLDRPQEGDPDFLADASRIYVSMRTNGDANFNVTSDLIYPAFEGDIENIVDSPFIVMKSDEIRIIARKETDRGTINGGIRIIKEGALNDDAASVYLLPSGIVQISGNKIYLGQPDQGAGPGEKGSEPYVKYSELEKLLTKTYDAIDQFCQKLLTHTTPGYGLPSPQITQGATMLQTDILQRKQEITNLQSTRVFGE